MVDNPQNSDSPDGSESLQTPDHTGQPQIPPLPAVNSTQSVERIENPPANVAQNPYAPNYQPTGDPGVSVHGPAYVNGPAFVANPPAPQGNGLGLAALIIGILALIGAFIPFVNFVSGLLALVGLVLGVIALFRKGRPKGKAIAGTILSAIAMVLSIILANTYTAGFVNAVDEALPHSQTKSDSDGSAADDEADDIGTRENPAPLGTAIELTSGGSVEYEVTLGDSILNANDLVAEANQFNDEPDAGYQYAMVPVTVVYKGSETGSPWIDITVEFVSADGTTHTTSDALAVAPKPGFNDINDLYPDASATGNIVIMIPSEGAEDGTWAVSSLFSGDPYFFAAQ